MMFVDSIVVVVICVFFCTVCVIYVLTRGDFDASSRYSL